MMRQYAAAAVLFFLFTGGVYTSAINTEEGLTIFIKEHVAAMNASDRDAYLQHWHPKVREALAGEAGEFFESTLSEDLKRRIPENYRLQISPIGPTEPLFMSDRLTYPARPSYWVTIDYDASEYNSISLMRQVAFEDGVWRIVFGIPDAAAIAQWKESRDAKQKAEAAAGEAFAAMDETLKNQIGVLLKQGRKIEAIKQYRAASGVGLYEAQLVVEKMAEEL